MPWLATPLPAPAYGPNTRTGHEDPVSPVAANKVRPSSTPCSSVCSATGSSASGAPVPYIAFWSSLLLNCVGIVLSSVALAGEVSHSPNDALACLGPFGSPTHLTKSASTS